MERLVKTAMSGSSSEGGERMDAHRKVMFVDDDPGVRDSWSRYLSAEGFDVTTAEDGDRAIRQLEREPVDVVVSDLRMPRTDGVELLEWIHDHKPETPFVLLTGFGNAAVERKVRELGAFDYLNKPINPRVLSAVVTAATVMADAEERRRSASEALVAPAMGVAAEVWDAPLEAARAPSLAEEVTESVSDEAAPADEARERGRAMEALEVAGWLLAAPLLGLAFVVFLPVIGFVALIKTLAEIVWERTDPART
jgi:CheY-like chemotaxis protein